MNIASKDLEARINALSDEELLQMVYVDFDKYRQEALDFAKAESKRRGLVFRQSEFDYEDVEPSPVLAEDIINEENIWECEACGAEVSIEANVCPSCGADISEVADGPPRPQSDPSQQPLASLSGTGSLSRGQQPYEYQMVQIPSNFSMSANQMQGNEIASYVQEWANRLAASGWEFYRIDTMGVTASPGCLAGLFGAQQTYTQYSIMTFRRLR